jgi:hypothetical protein
MNGSKITLTAIAAMALALTACSKGSNVSVSAKAATAGDTGSASCPLSLNGGAVCIGDVQIAVRRVSLENAVSAADAGTTAPSSSTGALSAGGSVADHGGSGGGDGSGDDDATDEGEQKIGPCFVDLSGSALTTGALSGAVCAGEIPDGTFEELKVIIGPVSATAAASVTGLGDMNGESVIVKDQNGKVIFQSTLHVVQKTETSVTVSSSTNVTLTFDPTNWFKAADGTTNLDPSDSANQSQIENNIKASIRAFQDDDDDGQEDHGHDGQGHH